MTAFRDDSLRVWEAMHQYVKDVLALYYPDDATVTKDDELAAMLLDLRRHGLHRRSDIPERSVFLMKSTQRTNFQSISYFAYTFMKLTLINVKVVKYFSLWHNFILNVPVSSAQNLLPGKVPARLNISRKWQISTNTLLTKLNLILLFKTVFYCVCLLILEPVCIKFYKKSKYEKCLNLFCSEKLPARKTGMDWGSNYFLNPFFHMSVHLLSLPFQCIRYYIAKEYMYLKTSNDTVYAKGPSIKYVRTILPIFDPPPSPRIRNAYAVALNPPPYLPPLYARTQFDLMYN